MVVPGRGTRKILREFQIIAARRGHGSAAAAAGGWSVAVIADVHAARPGDTTSTPRSVQSIRHPLLLLARPTPGSRSCDAPGARAVTRAPRAATHPSCPH